MQRCVLISALVAITGCAQSNHLRRDEEVVFFPTVGYAVDGGTRWVVPVRGWVYESSWLSRHLNWAGHVLDIETYIEDPAERATLRERIMPFVVDGSKGREVPIVVGEQTVRLSPASDNGHFYEELRFEADHLGGVESAETTASILLYQAALSKNDQRRRLGRVHLLPPEGISIVSDIDDTIRITDVNHTQRMMKNTFVEAFRPVPGMSELYQGWAERWGAQFHYLSASPAQLAGPMDEFLEQNGFPQGSVTLRAVSHEGSTLKMVLSMFDAPPDYKTSELSWLLRALPNRRYMLIGDSGQSDPEVYGMIARAFRPQVQMILIRDVTCCEGRNSPRYQAAFQDLPDSMWLLFRDPAEIRSRFGDKTTVEQPQPRNHSGPPWQDVFVGQFAAYN